MRTHNDWETWKATLGKAVDLGETVGMSDKTIINVADKIGTFLSNNITPSNDEERLLKELWDVSDEKEKNVLSNLVIKMVDKY